MLSQAIDIVRNYAGSMTEKADMLGKYVTQIQESTGARQTGWEAVRMTGSDGSQIFLGSAGRAVIINAEGQLFVGQLGSGLRMTRQRTRSDLDCC
jgi:hypothetical protein